jgi:XTP/dITP diphosphohydrolase
MATAAGPASATRVVVATRNKGKLREIVPLLEGLGLELVTIDALAPEAELREDGVTFEENALAKARQAAAATGLPAIADDSGLEVDALDGAPGVWSAPGPA